MELENSTYPIFIGGYMHSGTSLLANLFIGNSNCYVVNGESRFFDHLEYNLKRFSSGKADDIDKTARYLFKNFSFNLLNDPAVEKAFKNNYDVFIQNGPTDFFSKVISDVSAASNKKIWVEKTPTNLFHINTIRKEFPNSKILIIHRDVRDIIASKKTRLINTNDTRYGINDLKRKKLEKDVSILADSFSWRSAINYQMLIEKNQMQDVKTFAYEDLVLRPKENLMSICDFIDIPFETKMLDTEFSNSSEMQSSSTGIYKDSLEKWKSKLTNNEIYLVEYICKNQMKYLGYQPLNQNFNYVKLTLLIIGATPLLIRRVIKRFRYFNFSYLSLYTKNLTKRIFKKKNIYFQ